VSQLTPGQSFEEYQEELRQRGLTFERSTWPHGCLTVLLAVALLLAIVL